MRLVRIVFVLSALLTRSALADIDDDYKNANDAIRAGRFDEAIAIATRALKSGNLPADKQYLFYFDRGVALSIKGDAQPAIADLSKVIEARQDTAEPYYFRGLAYYQIKDGDHAIADLTSAIKLDPR